MQDDFEPAGDLELQQMDLDAMRPNQPIKIVLSAIAKVNRVRGCKTGWMYVLTPLTCGTMWCCTNSSDNRGILPAKLTEKCQNETINVLITHLTEELKNDQQIAELRANKRLAATVVAQVKLALSLVTTAVKDQELPQDYKTALVAAKKLIKDTVRPTANTRIVQMLDTDGADKRDQQESRDHPGYQPK